MDLKQNFRKSANAYFTLIFKQLLGDFGQQLFTHANSARSNTEERIYLESMKSFKAQREEFAQRYEQFLAKSFEDFFAGVDEVEKHQQRAIEELSLIEKDELEDELALSIMSSRCNTKNAEALWKLNRRLAVLRGGKPVDDDANPCGPPQLCQALQYAVADWQTENKVKIQFYKAYDVALMHKAGELYEKLNEFLIGKKILPNLKFQLDSKAADQQAPGKAGTMESELGDAGPGSGPGPAQPGSPQPATPPQQGITPTQPYITTLVWGNPQEEARQQELIDSVRGLQLTSARGATRSNTASGVSYNGLLLAPGDQGSTMAFNPTDYAFALSAVQQKLQLPNGDRINLAKPPEFIESELIDRLKALSSAGDRARITDEDAVTIDLVGMLFRYVLDDPKLPDSVKTLLSHLHTPFLKVALIDDDFFSNPQHAARRMLNLMAEIGSRWVVEGKNDRVVMPKLRGIVSRILQEFIDDVQLFEDSVNDLVEFARTMEKRADLAEKRNKEAQEGLERLAKAKNAAIEAIEERVGDRPIPEVVQRWLEQTWTDFVAFNYIRFGGKGVAWDGALNVIDNVLSSVHPDTAASFVENRVKRGAMIKVIEKGLNTIGYDGKAAEQLIKDLCTAQDAAVRQAINESVSSTVTDSESPSTELTGDSSDNNSATVSDPQNDATEVQPAANEPVENQHELAQPELVEAEVVEAKVAEAKVAEAESVDSEGEVSESEDTESAAAEVAEAETVEAEIAEPSVTVASSEDSIDAAELNVETGMNPGQAALDEDATPASKGAIQRQLQTRLDSAQESGADDGFESVPEPVAEGQSAASETAVQRQLRLRRSKVAQDFTVEEEEILSSLDFGDWFEFKIDGEKKPQKLKLAWFSSISDRYMFVNAAGVKCQVKSCRELLDGFGDSSIRTVDETEPTFLERAFETILKGMRKVTSNA